MELSNSSETTPMSSFLRIGDYTYVNLNQVVQALTEPSEDEEDVMLKGADNTTILRVYGEQALALRTWLERNLTDFWEGEGNRKAQSTKMGLVRVGQYSYVNLDRAARIYTEPGEEGEEDVQLFTASDKSLKRYYEAEAGKLRAWLEANSTSING